LEDFEEEFKKEESYAFFNSIPSTQKFKDYEGLRKRSEKEIELEKSQALKIALRARKDLEIE
jgi:hypothetical protein